MAVLRQGRRVTVRTLRRAELGHLAGASDGGYWTGTVDEWLALQNAAYKEIDEVIPDARVWGANLVSAIDQTDLDPDSHEDLDHNFWFNAVMAEIGCPYSPHLCCTPPADDHDSFRPGVLCREDPTDLNGTVLRKAVEEIRDWLEAP